MWPRGRNPLRDPTLPCARQNGPHGLSGHRHTCTTNVGTAVGCRLGGSDDSRPPMCDSNIAWNTSVSSTTTSSVSKLDIVAACARKSATGALPVSISPAREARHHFLREESQTVENLFLRDRLHRV